MDEIEELSDEEILPDMEDIEKLKLKEIEEAEENPIVEKVDEDELEDIPEEGHEFPMDGFCIRCGESLDPDMAYCWKCGTKYSDK